MKRFLSYDLPAYLVITACMAIIVFCLFNGGVP